MNWNRTLRTRLVWALALGSLLAWLNPLNSQTQHEAKATQGSKSYADRKAIWELCELTESAFKQADAQALAVSLMDDADMIMPDGTLHKGAAEIVNAHADYFVRNRGVRIKFTRRSLQFLKPDVVLEDAAWEEYGGQPGFATHGFDTAIVVLRNGKWRYQNLRAWIPPASPKASGAEHAADIHTTQKQ